MLYLSFQNSSTNATCHTTQGFSSSPPLSVEAMLPRQTVASLSRRYKNGDTISRRTCGSFVSSSPITQHLSSFSTSTTSPGQQMLDNLRPPSHPANKPLVNARLDAIKAAGLAQLHNQTQDLISRTREPLFDDNNTNDPHGHGNQSVAQIQEATRLELAITEALAYYSSRQDTFSIRGECIDVLGVEVSADLKQARVYWCLPYSIDIRELPSAKLELVVRKMQQRLDEQGSKIQGLVHTRLRAYYPPKLQFVAAEHVSKDLKRGFSLEKGKKKWR
jgi:ribosome-binding factor A